nr:DNA methyltransferase [Streptomyces sp. SID4951]
MAWHAEVNPDASRILARHWPDVPNLGDITTVDWSAVPWVCVLTAGFPCQRRLGRRPTGRTQLPDSFRAVAARRPCGRSPPSLPGCDRECARPPHLPRRFPWRRGILSVVSGRHPRADLPRRLARRRRCSRRRPATSRRTAAHSTPPSGRAAVTGRTWPTRWSGSCCRHRRRRTGSRGHPTSVMATGT